MDGTPSRPRAPARDVIGRFALHRVQVVEEVAHWDLLAVPNADLALAPLDRGLADAELADVLALVVGDVEHDAVVAELRLDVRGHDLHGCSFRSSRMPITRREPPRVAGGSRYRIQVPDP